MADDDDTIPERVLREAAAWAFRLEAEPRDAAVRKAFEAWLDGDPGHRRAWLLARKGWMLSGLLAPASTGPATRSSPTRRSYRGIAAMAAAAALLVAAVPTISPWLHAGAAGGAVNQRLSLNDGSTVILAGESAVEQHFTAARRAVTLVEGEAWFDVAHDARRPFTVQAADMTVTVTGTAFDVSMSAGTLSVGVGRGSVRVERAGRMLASTALTPGEVLAVDRESGRAAVGRVAVPEIGAWRGYRFVARGTPLADAVETLGRYFKGAIIVTDPAMERREITGVYDLDDPERALRAMTAPFNGTVRRVTPWMIFVSPS